MQQYTISLAVTVAGVISFVSAMLIELSQNYSGAQCTRSNTIITQIPAYQRTLYFNIYTFTVEIPDTGASRVASIKAWRGQLLLTNFQVRIDGDIAGTGVADLDANRFPELYVFSSSSGSGSFGRVYGWQFLPERRADITPVNWQLPPETGYMGHDSLWLEPTILCRRFPRYNPGDTNANPTGGIGMLRYQLGPAGQAYALRKL